MPDEQTLYCPFCGKNIPANVEKCPFCQTPIERVIRKRELDKIIEKRIMRKLKSSNSAKDDAAPTLPETPMPEVKVSCPGCGLELKGGETKCSRCGVPLAGEDNLMQCPDCGASFAEGAKTCPKCGVKIISRVGYDVKFNEFNHKTGVCTRCGLQIPGLWG